MIGTIHSQEGNLAEDAPVPEKSNLRGDSNQLEPDAMGASNSATTQSTSKHTESIISSFFGTQRFNSFEEFEHFILNSYTEKEVAQ